MTIIPIKGWSDYWATSEGHILSTKWGKLRPLKHHVNEKGYARVRLSQGKRQVSYSVHRLILKTFCPTSSTDLTVHHRDGNPLNNAVDNLTWLSRSDNTKEAWSSGRKRGYVLTVAQIEETRRAYSSFKKAKKKDTSLRLGNFIKEKAEALECSPIYLRDILAGRRR